MFFTVFYIGSTSLHNLLACITLNFSSKSFWNFSTTTVLFKFTMPNRSDTLSFFVFHFPFNLILSLPSTRKWPELLSAPRTAFTFKIMLLNLAFKSTWSIWCIWCPSRDIYIPLCTSLYGTIVLSTSRFFFMAKYVSLQPLSLDNWCRIWSPIIA